MAYCYETVVSIGGLEMFQLAFCRYMEALDFDHMGVGGRLGGHKFHDFRRIDDLVSFSVSDEGQSRFRIVVHSDTVHVERLVLDSLTEGVADFLEPFCEALSDRSSQQILHALIDNLRDAFDRVIGEKG